MVEGDGAVARSSPDQLPSVNHSLYHNRNLGRILYSPTVGANIISRECAFQLLGDEPLVQTDKTFQTSSRKILEGIGILQNVTVKHENVNVILDFHVFDVQDFDLMIGHPIEKFLMDASTQGKLDVRLGKENFLV